MASGDIVVGVRRCVFGEKREAWDRKEESSGMASWILYANKICRLNPAKHQYKRLVVKFNSDFCTPPNMYGVAKRTKSTQPNSVLHLKAKLKSLLRIVVPRTRHAFFPSFVPRSHVSHVTHDEFGFV